MNTASTKSNTPLSLQERQIMADMYKEAKIRPVVITNKTFAKYRKEWE